MNSDHIVVPSFEDDEGYIVFRRDGTYTSYFGPHDKVTSQWRFDDDRKLEFLQNSGTWYRFDDSPASLDHYSRIVEDWLVEAGLFYGI